MVNQELLRYISRETAEGVEKAAIMRDLLKAGWPQADVYAAFLQVSATPAGQPVTSFPGAALGRVEPTVSRGGAGPTPTSVGRFDSPAAQGTVRSSAGSLGAPLTTGVGRAPATGGAVGTIGQSAGAARAGGYSNPWSGSYDAPVLDDPDAMRKKLIAIGAGIVVVVLLIGGAVYLSARNQAATPTDSTASQVIIPTDDVPLADLNNISPTTYLTTWNYNELPPAERRAFYNEKKLADGSTQREYTIAAESKTITVANGFTMEATAYNGQVPGPTMRATEGDTIIVHFTNKTKEPHSMHFSGNHSGSEDGSLTEQFTQPGKSDTYTFKAGPAGLQYYRCHVEPMSEHTNFGEYGAFIVDPKNDTRPKPTKEYIMTMNSFDLEHPAGSDNYKNGEGKNTVYTLNSVAFWYLNHPIPVRVGELYRVYLLNMTEFQPVNSFHVHGTTFTETPGGLIGSPTRPADTTMLGQGERSELDLKFNSAGDWLFHSESSEFTAKGWEGAFKAQ